jgi:WD40 repeat protein
MVPESTELAGEGPVADIILGYLEAVDEGEAPDPQQLLAQHPEWAEELTEFFETEAFLATRYEPFREESEGPPPETEIPVFGPFENLRYVGEGGMGVVYQAWDTKDQRAVAVKLLKGGRGASAEDKRRFRREAENMELQDHANIVRVYEVGEHEGRRYFSMELMEGGSLAGRLNEYRLPAPDTTPNRDAGGVGWTKGGWKERAKKIARLMTKVARAVHDAHQRGLLHRDLKPGNILLDAQGEPHVADFGLAKRLEGKDTVFSSGMIVGTPAYMAPEQAAGQKGPRMTVDVYGLGAVLYELLTGRPPFQGSVCDILLQVKDQDPVPPRRLCPRVPRDLETICLSCLEKEASKRYPDAQEVAQELWRFQKGKPIRRRRISTGERLVKWVRRKPAAAALCAVLSLMAVAVLLGAVLRWREATADRERLQASLYVAKVAEANQKLWVSSPHEAEEALQECPAHLRGWEWYFLNRWWQAHLVTLRGHTAPVQAVAVTPDGTLLVTGGRDNTVRLWDPRTGKEVTTLGKHHGWVEGLAFSADGRRLVSASRDRMVKLWDVPGRKVLRKFPGAGRLATISPDGRLVVSTGLHEGVSVWDVKTGKEHRFLSHDYPVECLAFSPDGKRLACGGWGKQPPVIWDTATWKRVSVFGKSDAWSHPINDLAFSPDGRYFAVATGSGARIWKISTGEELPPATYSGVCARLSFSRDGKHLAVAFNTHKVAVWDVDKSREVFIHTAGAIPGVAFVPTASGRRIAFLRGHEVVVEQWQGQVEPPGRTLPALGNLTAAAFSGSGGRLAIGSPGRMLTVWNMHTCQSLFSGQAHKGAVTAVAFSPDGRSLVSASEDGTVKLWDAASGQELRAMPGHGGRVNSVAFSPNGEQLASAGEDWAVKVWDVATGQQAFSLDAGAAAKAVAFSQDGQRLAVGCGDSTVRVWKVGQARAVRTLFGHREVVTGVAFSRDGRLASASKDGTVRVQEVDSDNAPQILSGRSRVISSLTFSPDDRRLALGGLDGKVRLWDLATRKELLELPGSSETVGLAFSADGHFLAAVWRDGKATLWDGRP